MLLPRPTLPQAVARVADDILDSHCRKVTVNSEFEEHRKALSSLSPQPSSLLQVTHLVPGFEPGFGGISDMVAECPDASRKLCGFQRYGSLGGASMPVRSRVFGLRSRSLEFAGFYTRTASEPSSTSMVPGGLRCTMPRWVGEPTFLKDCCGNVQTPTDGLLRTSRKRPGLQVAGSSERRRNMKK